MLSRLSCGGEEGIRTLETLAGLHDFQSCALDQLGDFSIAAQENGTICSLLPCNSFIIIPKSSKMSRKKFLIPPLQKSAGKAEGLWSLRFSCQRMLETRLSTV